MGRLVDDAVVVLESIHRHQRQGLSPYQAALEGTNAVALPVLASTLTTMAVLLPVVLLAGLAKKLFVPLAITVAVSMIASYFVSMCVTPLACRYFLVHENPGRLRKAVAGFIDRVAEGYASALRRVLPFRGTVVTAAAVLVAASVWMAMKLPSTFFPEIDESMERIYVRLAPGTSLSDAAQKVNDMGKVLANELPKEDVELVLTNVGSPQNARSAMNSPNAGPHMGFIRVALAEPENRKASQREIADKMREILNRHYPGVEFLQWPGGLVASVFSNGYLAPLVVEISGDNLQILGRTVQGRGRRGRDGSRHSRPLPIFAGELSRNSRRDGSDQGRNGPCLVPRRRSVHAGSDPWQHQHTQRLDRRKQWTVVLRRHLS
jgi:multidrug efflux pump subunit AcrB